jgi:hypothetical protein
MTEPKEEGTNAPIKCFMIQSLDGIYQVDCIFEHFYGLESEYVWLLLYQVFDSWIQEVHIGQSWNEVRQAAKNALEACRSGNEKPVLYINFSMAFVADITNPDWDNEDEEPPAENGAGII